jgi:hypothetical protein
MAVVLVNTVRCFFDTGHSYTLDSNFRWPGVFSLLLLPTPRHCSWSADLHPRGRRVGQRKFVIPDEDIENIRSSLDGRNHKELAAQYGVCVDTLRRAMARQGLLNLDALPAKYIPSSSYSTPLWNRPCSGCGDTNPRPKWVFYCDNCHSRQARGALDLDD